MIKLLNIHFTFSCCTSLKNKDGRSQMILRLTFRGKGGIRLFAFIISALIGMPGTSELKKRKMDLICKIKTLI